METRTRLPSLKGKIPLNKIESKLSPEDLYEDEESVVHASGAQAFYKADKSRRNNVQLTTNQLSYMFDVTLMTIYNWRLNRGMPFYHLVGGKKPPVRYDEGLLLHWAESHGIPIEQEDYLKM